MNAFANPEPTVDPIISVRDLHKSFENVDAVRGLSFNVQPGEVVGFIGANGAGKTTTMRIMVTLEEATSGTAFICGHNVAHEPHLVRQKIGWMPDQYGAYANLTVWEYLDFYARSYGLKGERRASRVEEVIAFTELNALRDRMTNKLSKGQSQRVCLGRTLLNDPEVLILDEPAAGLDPKARIEFRNLVRLLAEAGKTVFISSHILSELAEMCNSMLFIDQGRIVHHGSADSLQQADSAVVYDVQVADDPAAFRRWAATFPGLTMVSDTQRGARVALDDNSPEAIAEIIRAMVRDGIPVVEFHREVRKLEDVFVRMLQSREKEEQR